MIDPIGLHGSISVAGTSISRRWHSEPFAPCHSERSEESRYLAQGKLREESRLYITTSRCFAALSMTQTGLFGHASSGRTPAPRILLKARDKILRLVLCASRILLSICFASLILEASSYSVCAQPFGKIAGTITDEKTGVALIGATIQVERTLLGANSNQRGEFLVRRVPPGKYMLRMSFVGYRTVRVPVVVARDLTSTLQVALEPTVIAFDQVVVTGSKQQEELRAAVNTIGVRTSHDILRRNNLRIDQALESVAGVNLMGDYVNIRGGSGNSRLGGSRVLVLLDDVPILTSDLALPNWDILPVTEIDRLEVFKGAASAMYGSGALSGVVNIISKPASSHATYAFRQTGGVYDEPSVAGWRWADRTLHYYRTDIAYSNTFGRLGVRLAGSHHYSTSDRLNGDFRRWYGTGKLVWRFPDASTLTLFGTYSHDARGQFIQWRDQNHALQPPETEADERFGLNGLISYLTYQKLFSSTFSIKARASYNRQLVATIAGLQDDFSPAQGWGGELQANWLPHRNHSLALGVDYKHDDVLSKFYGDRQANTIAPYVQEIWKISRIWEANAGVRYDTYAIAGGTTETQWSPKLGVSYRAFPSTILHASYGRAFRAASILERYLNVPDLPDFRVLPNTALKPERSVLMDVGIRQRFGDHLSAEATVFSSTYRELIEATLDPSLSVQFRNFPHARINGIETEMTLRVWKNRLGLEANATWMDPKDLEKNLPLPYRPRFIAFITPTLTMGAWTVEADYRYASRAEMVTLYPRDDRVAQKVLDLRAIFRWKSLHIEIGTKNAMNYNYTQVERYLSDIRNFYIALSGEF